MMPPAGVVLLLLMLAGGCLTQPLRRNLPPDGATQQSAKQAPRWLVTVDTQKEGEVASTVLRTGGGVLKGSFRGANGGRSVLVFEDQQPSTFTTFAQGRLRTMAGVQARPIV